MYRKRIGITQKLSYHSDYAETNLSLDIAWIDFLILLGVIPVPLPLVKSDDVETLIKELQLDGVILSGGNDVSNFSEGSKQQKKLCNRRDKFEVQVLKVCIKLNIPILGVCRGLQLINIYFSGSLVKVTGHINTAHQLDKMDPSFPELKQIEYVNSYHNWGITPNCIGSNLTPLAFDTDGCIECLKHYFLDIFAIMWHPERAKPFRAVDKSLIEKVLKLK